MKQKISIIFFLLINGLFYSCTHTSLVPDSPLVIFSKEVQPIILGNCTMSGCHTSGDNSGVFPLSTYDDIVTNGGVIAKNATGSNLYQSISSRGLAQQMPPSKYLSEADLQTIYLWIMQGAKNN